MLARGTRITMPADRLDAAIAQFVGTTAPAARRLAGNRGVVLLVDRDSGAGWTLTYWEDEAALRASEAAAGSLRSQAMAESGGKVEEIDRFELVLQERAAPAQAGTYVRVNDVRGDPSRIDDAIRFTRENALPVVRAQKGFRALILAINRQTGRAIVSSVWDTLADLRASEAAITPIRQEMLAAAGNATVRTEVFESVYADVPQPIPSS